MGAFCSWGCMKSFNLDRNGVNHGGIVGQNILLLRKKLCGTDYSIGIQCAPNRFALKVFGGELTIEEFRQFGSSERVITELPDEFKKCQIVTRPKYESKALSAESKIQEITYSIGSNETLKLKRTKPLKRDSGNNTLEKSLGITRKV